MSQQSSGKQAEPIKPYAFVPFAERVKRSDVAGHDSLRLDDHYTGRLVYTLKALTPIFVGSGSYALGEEVGFPQEGVVRPFCRVNGVLTIPGSSIKGVVRSIAEAVSPSCVTITRARSDALPRGVELAASRDNKCTATHACPACSIFGHSGQSREPQANAMSKTFFADARLTGNVKTELFRLTSLYAPRLSTRPRGRKFYHHSRPSQDQRQPPVEVARPGALFQGQVDFENLTAAEMGLLFFASGVDGSLILKLGGGKPQGLGALQIVSAEVRLLNPNHYLSAEAQETKYRGPELAQFMQQATDAAIAQRVLLRDQALALANILTAQSQRDAPQGPY